MSPPRGGLTPLVLSFDRPRGVRGATRGPLSLSASGNAASNAIRASPDRPNRVSSSPARRGTGGRPADPARPPCPTPFPARPPPRPPRPGAAPPPGVGVNTSSWSYSATTCAASPSAVAVDGVDRGLDLVRAGLVAAQAAPDQRLALRDQRRVPAARGPGRRSSTRSPRRRRRRGATARAASARAARAPPARPASARPAAGRAGSPPRTARRDSAPTG